MEETNIDKLIEQMHKISFSILCDIDAYCKEHDLTYYLSGGSCLGAVRHKGFIPWDHDADIMLPRKDYEKFIVGFAKTYKEKYGVSALATEPQWARQYSKVWDKETVLSEKRFDDIDRGVGVDVFPIDGLPSNKLIRKIYYKRTMLIFYLRTQMIRKGPFNKSEKLVFIKKYLRKHYGRMGARKYALKLEKLARKYDFDSSRLVGVSMACHYGEKETIERKYMSKQVFLPFEQAQFPVVNGYDRYLKNLYGDYMKVPKGEAEYQKYLVTGWEVKTKR